MAVSLKLADAYVDVSINRSQFNMGLAGIIATLRQVQGMGVIDIRLDRAAATSSLGLLRQQLDALKAAAVVNVRVDRSFVGGAASRAGGGLGAGFGGGAAGQGLAGLTQGLGLSGFALNPAMAAGQMAGGVILGGWKLIAEGIGESASTAIELQSTFLDLQRVTGGSAENVGRLKTAVFDIANKQAGVSVADVTGIMMGGAKAGVGEKEGDAGLIRFTQGIARIKNAMGEGEGLNAERLTNDTTKILNVFGLGTEKVEGFGSALVRMANISTASGADIVQMTRTLSGTFKSLDVDVGMAMAISSVITDVGLTNQQGANAMSQFLRNMASGSAEMADKIGMPVEEFQQKIRTDAIGAFQLVLEKFKEINAVDPIKGQEFVKGLGYEGIRAAGAFQQLSSMIDQMQERAKIAREEMSSLAALTSADVLKSEATAGGILKLQNAFVELKNSVGEYFLPAINAGTAALTDLTRAAAGNMPAIMSGAGMVGKAVVGTPAAAAMGAAPGLMGWMFGAGPESAPAIPGKATGMAPRGPAGPRVPTAADIEADNQRRRALAAARPGAAALIADMAEEIGGVGNLVNAPSRFREAGGLTGWGTGTSGLAQWGRTDEARIAEEERDRKKFEEAEKRPTAQAFADSADYARDAIQKALSGERKTPEEQLAAQKKANEILTTIANKILPPNMQMLTSAPLIFKNP